MTKTALIHIGTRKTGTTSIQHMLAAAGEGLGPFRYPLMGWDRDQNRLVTLYLPPEQWPVHWRHATPETCRQYRLFLSEELATADGAILSGEALSTWFTLSAAQRLREDLERLGFQRFFVILYVRDPADYFLSFTQQSLKASSVESPGGYHPASFTYEIRRIAQTWEAVFPDRLVVREFHGGPEGDVAADFAVLLRELLGVSVRPQLRRMNTTLSAEAMQILQDYRMTYWPDNGGILTADIAKLVQFLEQSVTDVPQTKPVLKPAVASRIRANHQADADYLLSHYGVDLGLAGARPPASGDTDWGFRVADLVESVDPVVVQQILLRFVRALLDIDESRLATPRNALLLPRQLSRGLKWLGRLRSH